MPKTLKSVTGKRPRCRYRDNELLPDTSTVELTGHLSEAPAEATFAPYHGYHPDRVFKLKHRNNYAGEPVTSISYWRGTYIGYGLASNLKGSCTTWRITDAMATSACSAGTSPLTHSRSPFTGPA